MDSATSISIIVACSLIASFGLYYYYNNKYSFWKRENISGPRPYYILGHLLHLFYNNKTDFVKKSIKEYGRVFGIYEGTEPVLMIADPEIVRQICIKDFDIFPNHQVNKLFSDVQKSFIFFQQDDQWRRLRALMSPTFTSAKMRKMVNLLSACVDDLLLSIEEEIDGSQERNKTATINVRDCFSMYTMDAISTCCYATKLERVKKLGSLGTIASRNQLVADANRLFKFDYKRLFIAFTLNQRLLGLLGFKIISEETTRPMMDKVRRVIESRRRTGNKFDDYLQLLLDAKLDRKIELDNTDKEENHHASLTNESIKSDQENLFSKTAEAKTGAGVLNDIELISNAMLLMVVGLETTASLLSNCTYALAFHKDKQNKLREEVRKLVAQGDNESNLKYDSITSCHYLDAVLSETLRMLSPFMMTDRFCNQDYYIEKCDLTLRKGSKVFMLNHEIMNDPEYWPEPEKFRPERFLPENRDSIVPGSYLPFGIGPRHCLGMRFSLTESKLALARTILKFEFEPTPGTLFPPKIVPNLGLRKVENPVVNVRRLQSVV